jgi:hypothetical protein
MSSTLHTTCPLCGLRFPGRPLLDLHVREDHSQRNRPGRASVRAVLDDYAAQYNRHRQHPAWNLRLPGDGEIAPAAITDLRWWTYDAAGCCAD